MYNSVFYIWYRNVIMLFDIGIFCCYLKYDIVMFWCCLIFDIELLYIDIYVWVISKWWLFIEFFGDFIEDF